MRLYKRILHSPKYVGKNKGSKIDFMANNRLFGCTQLKKRKKVWLAKRDGEMSLRGHYWWKYLVSMARHRSWLSHV